MTGTASATEAALARVHSWQGTAAVTLAAGDLSATFLPELGMLGASLTLRGEELLALPGGLEGYRQGHVTGLPLLAPWANRLSTRHYRAAGVDVDLDGVELHTDPGGLPIHGTVTAHPGWHVTRLDTSGSRAVMAARLDYGAWPELLTAFPFPHAIEVEAGVDGTALTVTTTLRPSSDQAVPVAFGWHPYLRLPTGPRDGWRLVLPDREHLELDARGIPTGASTAEPAEQEPIAERTFDDLYAIAGDRAVGLEAEGWRLGVRFEQGYPYAQVFVPPGAEFACLEPMTAPTDALTADACPLADPGAVFTTRFSITAEPAG
ncbi:MAG TPA: aldose 1-epimerase [Actinomycetes bacterium]|nr:aldose 1-epimerase [Actinomycetes bacterium]